MQHAVRFDETCRDLIAISKSNELHGANINPSWLAWVDFQRYHTLAAQFADAFGTQPEYGR